ncbi:hypothetical protein AMTR_s00005p00239090 [Amborella trichopoda]|uniref:FAD/NAD(P)-binding domain-containing protein n=1 Tax=Amborella trichopoda TaxID=13333 RepID=W1PIB3_AMBTC|nr:hypothetical protein AMTR_s00005p00239090 [Amborella trichopoda]
MCTNQDCKTIRNAGTILIIGGGPAGLELAGELSVDFPQKNLIIVHGGVRLIDFLGLKASKKALEWLNKRGVNVYFEERITEDGLPGPEDEGDGLYTMSSGKTVTADCHFLCTGKKINSSWLKGTAFEDSLDERGFLKVDRSLMLEGHPNVFAVGYITNMKEMRQGLLAQKHAEVVAENIRKLSKGSNKIITYKPGPPIGMVSLGRSLAIAQMPWGTMLGRLPGMLKSKDLYVGKTRKALGFKS